MASNIAKFDAVRSIDYADISDEYQPLMTSSMASPNPSQGPFLYPIRIIHFINSTDGIMMVSLDGVNDQIPVLAGTGVIYDITSDEDADERMRIPTNTQVYVKYITAPTMSGGPTFWCTAEFGQGE